MRIVRGFVILVAIDEKNVEIKVWSEDKLTSILKLNSLMCTNKTQPSLRAAGLCVRP